MGMMNPHTQTASKKNATSFGRNNFYVTATFTLQLKAVIDEALQGRDYTIRWKTTGLPKWFPVQEWNMPLGDFFGMYIQFNDVEE